MTANEVGNKVGDGVRGKVSYKDALLKIDGQSSL